MSRLLQYNGLEWVEIGKNGVDGRTPVAGIDFVIPKNGSDGKDGSPDTGDQIVQKINELAIRPELQIDAKHIKGLPKGDAKWTKRLGRGTSSPILAYDLSDYLDGATKVFTIPANKRIVNIVGSSSPFTYRPTTDFGTTGTGNTTLTFTSSVDAPSALATGQTLIVLYIEA